MRGTAPMPRAVPTGAGTLALAMGLRACGRRGLNVLRQNRDRAPPGC